MFDPREDRYWPGIDPNADSPSVGDYLQVEGVGRIRRFPWAAEWPPPVRLRMTMIRNTAVIDGGGCPVPVGDAGVADSVVPLIRVSFSQLPPQTADSRVARGALYRPEDGSDG